MGAFIVEGGARLCGRVAVSGSKNAALPVIFASLLSRGKSRIVNLPDITDVSTALELIALFGAEISRKGSVTVINSENVRYTVPPPGLTERIRASTYLIGASLSRFSRAELGSFGGCAFGPRPIDMHLECAELFGAVRDGDTLTVDSARPFSVSFRQRSVGATVNALIMASAAPGESRIYGGACEPHIDTLISFLRSMGAEIEVMDGVISVRGGELYGGEVTVPGDMIEAGTFLALSLLNGGCVEVEGAKGEELLGFLSPFISSGAAPLRSCGAYSLHGAPSSPVHITTEPYPGFPTDLQPIAAPMLALHKGGSITDTVWRGRYGYLSELGKMGVEYEISDNTALIKPSVLNPASVRALDLRGGAACLLAALMAKGESRISDGELLFRGYENLTEKLTAIGGKIRYER